MGGNKEKKRNFFDFFFCFVAFFCTFVSCSHPKRQLGLFKAYLSKAGRNKIKKNQQQKIEICCIFLIFVFIVVLLFTIDSLILLG